MLVGPVLVALMLLAAAGHRWGVLGAVALAAVSVLWLFVNGSAEGPILWKMTPDHGLTSTDLAGLAGLGVAAWRGWRAATAGAGVAGVSTRRRRDDGGEPPR